MTREKAPRGRSETGDPLLLTPGPLTTAARTRAAMLEDYSAHEKSFALITAEVRKRLQAILGAGPELTTVPIQGGDAFAVEAALGTLLPPEGRALVLHNGACGARLALTCRYLKRAHYLWEQPEDRAPRLQDLEKALTEHEDITHVLATHCETSTGLLNPLEAIATIVARHERKLIVDAASTFGAVPITGPASAFEAVVASSDKCLEGPPGVGFVIARRDALEAARGRSHSLSLDLHAQIEGFEKDGHWRLTPPTHVMAGFAEALRHHGREGGVPARNKRYRENTDHLLRGMRELHFDALLPAELQSPITVTFLEPEDPAWDFARFYAALADRGFVICPGALASRPSFRVGCIGQIEPGDIERFLDAVAGVLEQIQAPAA